MRLTAFALLVLALALPGCGSGDNLRPAAGDAAAAADAPDGAEAVQMPAHGACADKTCNATCAENLTTWPLDCGACDHVSCDPDDGGTTGSREVAVVGPFRRPRQIAVAGRAADWRLP